MSLPRLDSNFLDSMVISIGDIFFIIDMVVQESSNTECILLPDDYDIPVDEFFLCHIFTL